MNRAACLILLGRLLRRHVGSREVIDVLSEILEGVRAVQTFQVLRHELHSFFSAMNPLLYEPSRVE